MKRVRPWTKSATFRYWDAPADKLDPAGLWTSAQLLITELAGADAGPAQ